MLGPVRAKVVGRRATFTSSLSEAARVVLTVRRPRTCRRVRGRRRCLAARTLARKTLAPAKAGPVQISFARRLPRGTFDVRLTAVDAAGNAAAPRTLRLRVR